MSDYLRNRFPLADTSTVYMSGKSVYNLVRYNKPGIIGSVELLPGDAEMFRAAVRDAMADAWDGGVARSESRGADSAFEENPYRGGTNP